MNLSSLHASVQTKVNSNWIDKLVNEEGKTLLTRKEIEEEIT